jgi:plastocyanin
MRTGGLVFAYAVTGVLIVADASAVLARDVRVTVRSQTIAPTMALDPESTTIHAGDTVTWVNLTGRGIKLILDWEDAPDLPSYIRDGGTVQVPFHRQGSYRYSVFTATERFQDDRVPIKVSGVVLVNPAPASP